MRVSPSGASASAREGNLSEFAFVDNPAAGSAQAQGVWSHVVATFNRTPIGSYGGPGSTQVEMFIDGESLGVSEPVILPDPIPIPSSANFRQRLGISAGVDFTYDSAPSFIAEVAIYDRILSPDEISEHFSLAEPVAPPPAIPSPFEVGIFSFANYRTDLSAQPGRFSCAVQTTTSVGWCFADPDNLELYIAEALLGEPQFGPIWLGDITEEVVSP